MKTIVKMKFGSHLYGTDTPQSDLDFKGVFQASYEDIILKKDKHSIVTCTKDKKAEGIRNSSDDVDVEMKELRRFLYDCQKGQTYALDMIFAPLDFLEQSSETWEYIIKNRGKLLSKHVEPYIGYCRQQAGKYGLKGSRLGELKRVIKHLEKAPAKTLMESACNGLAESEFVYFEDLPVQKNSEVKGRFLNVLGKKFQFSIFVEQALYSLNKMNDEYGHRAKLAMNNEGIDWKAISHAYRCCYQLIELAETGEIRFPLKEAEYLKRIKLGAESGMQYSEIQDELYTLMQKAIEAVERSNLPDEPDQKFWDDFIINTYKNDL